MLAYFAGNDLSDNQVFLEMGRAGKSIADKVHQNRSPLEYLVTVHLALYLRDAVHKANIRDCPYPQVAHTETPTPVAFFDNLLPTLALDTDTLRASDMFQATLSSILGISEALAERGIRFVMMYIPQKAELFWDYLGKESKRAITSRIAETNWPITPELIDQHISVQRDLWGAIALERRIEFLDMTPALRSAIDSGKSPYFFGDTHWNQFGHDLAREELQDLLK